MKLFELKKTTDKSKKRLGRGYGSGKGGHTVTRGQKGQKTRGKMPLWFIGTSKVWFKHLPMIRGKSRMESLQKPVKLIALSALNVFKTGETVNVESLVKKGLLTEKESHAFNLKILNSGKLEKKLKVELPVSAGAAKKITDLGGEVQGEAA